MPKDKSKKTTEKPNVKVVDIAKSSSDPKKDTDSQFYNYFDPNAAHPMFFKGVVPKTDFHFRGDKRPPEVVFADGFKASGKNMDIIDHAAPKGCQYSSPDSGYVSTSTSKEMASSFPRETTAKEVYLYQVNPSVRGVDVAPKLEEAAKKGVIGHDDASCLMEEKEIARRHRIPASDVHGVWKVEITNPEMPFDRVVKEEYLNNPNYLHPGARTQYAAKGVGRALTGVGVVLDGARLVDAYKDGERTGSYDKLKRESAKVAGGWTGAWAGGTAGGAAGAAAGGMGGPIGATIGAVAGGVVGSVAGYFAGETTAEVVYDAATSSDAKEESNSSESKENESDKAILPTPPQGPTPPAENTPPESAPPAAKMDSESKVSEDSELTKKMIDFLNQPKENQEPSLAEQINQAENVDLDANTTTTTEQTIFNLLNQSRGNGEPSVFEQIKQAVGVETSGANPVTNESVFEFLKQATSESGSSVFEQLKQTLHSEGKEFNSTTSPQTIFDYLNQATAPETPSVVEQFKQAFGLGEENKSQPASVFETFKQAVSQAESSKAEPARTDTQATEIPSFKVFGIDTTSSNPKNDADSQFYHHFDPNSAHPLFYKEKAPKTDFLYRGTVTAPEVVFSRGFKARGTNPDILKHVTAPGGNGSFADSAYISTSTSKKSASRFPKYTLEPKVYLYEINRPSNGVDIVPYLKEAVREGQIHSEKASLFFDEKEIAIRNKIKPSDIKGAWEVEASDFFSSDERYIGKEYTSNPRYLHPGARTQYAAKGVGRALTGVGVVLDGARLVDAYKDGERTGSYDKLKRESAKVAGGWTGAWAGASAGGAAGGTAGGAIGTAVAGPPGTAVGALVGGVVGSVAGSVAGYFAG